MTLKNAFSQWAQAPRNVELADELRRRGYTGELQMIRTIKM